MTRHLTFLLLGWLLGSSTLAIACDQFDSKELVEKASVATKRFISTSSSRAIIEGRGDKGCAVVAFHLSTKGKLSKVIVLYSSEKWAARMAVNTLQRSTFKEGL